MTDYSFRVVFDRIPEAPDGHTHFIELENHEGHSVRGEWREGEDGLVYLMIPPAQRVRHRSR